MKNISFLYAVFFKLLSKFSDLINYDNCIRKSISKSIRIYAVFIQKMIRI